MILVLIIFIAHERVTYIICWAVLQIAYNELLKKNRLHNNRYFKDCDNQVFQGTILLTSRHQ